MKDKALEHLIELVEAGKRITTGMPDRRDFEHFEAELIRASNYAACRSLPPPLHFTLPLTEGKTRSNLKDISTTTKRPCSPPPRPTSPPK